MNNNLNNLRILTERSNLLFFSYDLNENKFDYLNAAFELLFRVTSNKVTVEKLWELVHPEDKEYVKKGFFELKSREDKVDGEFRIRINSKEYWLRLHAFYIKENHRQAITGHIEDISAFKEHNLVLNKYSNKKNSILNILSHDLAAPLGSIQNVADLLSRRLKSYDDKEVFNLIEMIGRISRKGTTLIQDFVKQEFLESSAVVLIKRRIDLVEKIQVMIDEYKLSEKDMHKTFIFNHSKEKVLVQADETKFMQVISNLISNAIKFTPIEHGEITIDVREKEHSVVIEVADNGIGIPQKFHTTLFEKFSEARRQGLNGEPSVGLGMSIIKTIVEWHGGEITFKSQENKGATFCIEIPKE